MELSGAVASVIIALSFATARTLGTPSAFALTNSTTLNGATFTGLILTGSSMKGVVGEIRRVFPADWVIGTVARPPFISQVTGPLMNEVAFKHGFRLAA
jgi:hypothetical protein